MEKRATLERASEFGIAAGLRSMAGPALLSQHLSERPMWELDSPAERMLAHPATQILLGLGALGELVGDKLPSTPSRLEPRSLVFRAIWGAIGGGVLMHRARRPPLLGAALGALGAVGGASVGYHARKAITRQGVPDAAVAVVEDVFCMAIAQRAIRG
jgi:uncharacterized membrane protein